MRNPATTCHSEPSRPTFFFHVRSCERVGLRSEKSLFVYLVPQRPIARFHFGRLDNMNQGRCALCQRSGMDLCDSHLISEGVYWRAGEDRVVMTPEIFVSVSNQVTDYLLCPVCEAKLGAAENHVLPLVWQRDASFPLLEKLNANKPLGPTTNGSLVYSGSAEGIDEENFAYFALSMFWRASVHVWKTLNGQIISMPLRSWEEPVRKYLNGEAGFPASVVLKLTVCADAGSRGMVFAPVEWTNDLYTGYELTVLGVRFTMVVGVPPGAKDWGLCCVNSKNRVIFLEDCSDTSRDHYRDLRERARVAKNLVKK
jgi:hypothetical protein